MAKSLVILGAGGFAREASLLVEEINISKQDDIEWDLLGFIDEDRVLWGLKQRGYEVLGGWEVLEAIPIDVSVVCAVGDPVAKKRLINKALSKGRKFINLVHPDVRLARDVTIGEGVIINKGCMLTTNILTGDHVSINPGSGIGHDVVIGNYSTLMWRVNISGSVRLGESCLIGTGATILQGKTIGDRSIVGAGAVVVSDQPEVTTYVGIPARDIKKKR